MNGEDFCRLLRNEVGVDNNNQLAQKLGVAPAALTDMQRKESVGERQFANFIKRSNCSGHART
jgi:hypothetical protein